MYSNWDKKCVLKCVTENDFNTKVFSLFHTEFVSVEDKFSSYKSSSTSRGEGGEGREGRGETERERGEGGV